MRVTMQFITMLRRHFTREDCMVITFASFAIALVIIIYGITDLLF